MGASSQMKPFRCLCICLWHCSRLGVLLVMVCWGRQAVLEGVC